MFPLFFLDNVSDLGKGVPGELVPRLFSLPPGEGVKWISVFKEKVLTKYSMYAIMN